MRGLPSRPPSPLAGLVGTTFISSEGVALSKFVDLSVIIIAM